MCIRVRFERFDPLAFHPFDPAAGVVTLPDSLAQQDTLIALRAVLEELAITQPESGALCWCGEPVQLLPRVPEQRSGQVTNRGA